MELRTHIWGWESGGQEQLSMRVSSEKGLCSFLERLEKLTSAL